MKSLSEALGIEHTEIDYDNLDDTAFIYDKYATYGGGGAGHKNGHYGCNHSEETKRILSLKKKGKQTWNKGVTGYKVHTEASKQAMSEKLSGSDNGRAILTEEKVEEIISLYLQKPNLDNVGKVMQNGKIMSYTWAFCNQYASCYEITPAAMKRLLTKKTWKNVWSKYEV